jgi:hypothetical protein
VEANRHYARALRKGCPGEFAPPVRRQGNHRMVEVKSFVILRLHRSQIPRDLQAMQRISVKDLSSNRRSSSEYEGDNKQD